MGCAEEHALRPPLVIQHKVHQYFPVLAVESRCRFISKKKRRMPCHGTQEGNPLLLAAGKVLRTPVSFAGKPDALKEPVQFVLHEVPAGEPCGKADIFRYCQIRKDEGLLKDVPHLLRAETAFLLPCHLREIGSGNVAKLANQMVVAANIGICAEAMTFAKKMGTDPELVYQAIRGGLAGSTVMDAKVPMMLAGNYKPGFRIDLHIKDLNNALNASHAINMPVPMTAHMMEVMQELKNHDEGSCDHDDIIRYYERMTGVSIVKEK